MTEGIAYDLNVDVRDVPELPYTRKEYSVPNTRTNMRIDIIDLCLFNAV